MKSTKNLYIKTMYLLNLKHGEIRVTDIAEELSYTKSSVSKALARLSNDNLITYKAYGDIVLKSEAINIAKDILIKEDLLELFFMGILNVSKAQAKEDINVISEYVSKETNEKLKEYIIGTLKLNEKCKCNNNPNCEGCITKKIQKRVNDNPAWLKILKEEK